MKEVNDIFLIDDDPTFVFLATKTIEASKFPTHINIFNDGLEAIDFLKEIIEEKRELPDIIFLDLNMPVMDGWTFLDEFVSLQPQIGKKIEIYITSSTISPHDIERANNFSVVSDIIIKPLMTDKVIEVLSKL
jgi:CheY-like chemotaxis protein